MSQSLFDYSQYSILVTGQKLLVDYNQIQTVLILIISNNRTLIYYFIFNFVNRVFRNLTIYLSLHISFDLDMI